MKTILLQASKPKIPTGAGRRKMEKRKKSLELTWWLSNRSRNGEGRTVCRKIVPESSVRKSILKLLASNGKRVRNEEKPKDRFLN